MKRIFIDQERLVTAYLILFQRTFTVLHAKPNCLSMTDKHIQIHSLFSVKSHNAIIKHLKLLQNHEDFELKKLLITILVVLSKDSSVIPVKWKICVIKDTDIFALQHVSQRENPIQVQIDMKEREGEGFIWYFSMPSPFLLNRIWLS